MRSAFWSIESDIPKEIIQAILPEEIEIVSKEFFAKLDSLKTDVDKLFLRNNN
jgi:hypothetical protein